MASPLTVSPSGLAKVGGSVSPAPTIAYPATSSGANTALAPGQFSNASPLPAPAPKPTTSTPKVTPVVSPAPAINQVSQAKQIVTNANSTSQNLYNTTNGFVTPYGLSQGAKPVQPGDPANSQNSNTANTNSNNTTDSNTPEQQLLNTPEAGNQFIYGPGGSRTEVPVGSTLPAGYSSSAPSVQDTAVTNSGSSIKQMGDGTYGLYGIDGNYIGASSADQFNNIKSGQAALKSFNDFLATGGTSLNPAQQSQIAAVQGTYAALIAQQQVTNANATGVSTVAENMYGMGNTISGQGEITATVNDGLQKIATLTSKMNSDIANMTQGFEKDNLDLVKTGYDAYQTSSKALQDSIDTFQATVQKQQQKITDDQASVNNAYAKKYFDTTTPILPTDTAAQVQAKLQTSPSYMQDQKTKQGQVDQNVLDGMLKIYNKTGAIPAGIGNASMELKKAFYAAIGGNTNLVDEAAVNKAALGAATSALKTQQTQYEATKTSIGTLKSSMDRVDKYLAPLVDTGSPLLNGPLRDASGKILGSTTYSAFENEINTIASEYAKIITGASASIAGVSVQSVDDIKTALNDKITVGQLQTVLDAMRQDSNARLVSQQSTINQIGSDIKDLGNTSSSSGSSSSSDTSGITSGWAGF